MKIEKEISRNHKWRCNITSISPEKILGRSYISCANIHKFWINLYPYVQLLQDFFLIYKIFLRFQSYRWSPKFQKLSFRQFWIEPYFFMKKSIQFHLQWNIKKWFTTISNIIHSSTYLRAISWFFISSSSLSKTSSTSCLSFT